MALSQVIHNQLKIPKILADLRLWMSAGVIVRVPPVPTSPSTAAAPAVVAIVVPASSGEGSAAADRRQADERVVVALVEQM